MRLISLSIALWLLGVSAVWAQGQVINLSDLDFTAMQPVAAGETVHGVIQTPTGMLTIGDVYVEDQESDDMFSYWRGTYQRRDYYYDVYSGYWRPGPVSYRHAWLNFRDDVLEGWTRTFGAVVDYNNFFGQDGVLYKRINIERIRHGKGKNKRKIVYSYFINTATGERSDSNNPPYVIIGSDSREWVEEQMRKQEELYRQYVRQDPAFPNWRITAYELPENIMVADSPATAEDLSVMQLIEQETGVVTVEGESN